MAQGAATYSGKVTPVGNSKGIRIDAAFFREHPEFEGEVRATVLADGQVLLSAGRRGKRRPPVQGEDPVVLGFLRFLEMQMAARPDQIAPADGAQLVRIGKLVRGVDAG